MAANPSSGAASSRKCIACKNCQPMFPKPVVRSARTPRPAVPAQRHTCDNHNDVADNHMRGAQVVQRIVSEIPIDTPSESNNTTATSSTSELLANQSDAISDTTDAVQNLSVSSLSSGLWSPPSNERIDWLRFTPPDGNSLAAESSDSDAVIDTAAAVTSSKQPSTHTSSSTGTQAQTPVEMAEVASTSVGTQTDEPAVASVYSSSSSGVQTDEPGETSMVSSVVTQTESSPDRNTKVDWQSKYQLMLESELRGCSRDGKKRPLTPLPGPQHAPEPRQQAEARQPATSQQPVKQQNPAKPQQPKQWHNLWSVDYKKEW